MPYADPAMQSAYQRLWTRQRRLKLLGEDAACMRCGATEDLNLHHLVKAEKVSHRITTWAVARARCPACTAAARRGWTRETVVAAIRRFATEHGRPPTSTEWVKARNGYPAKGSVFRSRGSSRAPFASWADAIEAAGFPRPRVGAYAPVADVGVCAACGEPFAYQRRGTPRGYCDGCREGRRRARNRAQSRSYAQRHPDKIRAKARRYYQRHREEILARAREKRQRQAGAA